jgi:sugar lactone lactonase YvrE
MARSDSRRPALRPATAGLLACCAVLLCTLAGGAARARAEACYGSGARPCPWSSATVIGQRAGGVLRFPEAVAVGPLGSIYVADQLSYVVQKFSPLGAFEGEWGSFGAGPAQFGPIGGLATDAEGNVYVLDSSHDRIEKFNADGGYIGEWGAHGSQPGHFNFGSSQNFTRPPGGGIAVSGPYVYVADSGNNRIERFNLTGGEPLVWGTKGSGPGQFSYPRGVAANASEVLVSDGDNHRIEQFTPAGAYVGSAGSEGSGPGQFSYPYGVALDAAGDVFVADDTNHRVVELSPQLAYIGSWGGFGSKPGQLAFPRALAADPAGDTYVADTANDRIEVYDPNGNYLRTIGLSARGPGLLTAPRGLAVEPTGGLLASDTVGNRIELFAPPGDAYAGQWTATPGAGRAGFESPAGIATDPLGSVYIADAGNGRLAHFWGDGTFLSEVGGSGAIGGAGLSEDEAVAVSAPAAGELTYLADTGHNRILVYGPEGSLRARWGADGGSGAGGTDPGDFEHPAALAVDRSGNVYVADTGNDRIVELDPAGTVIAEWGATGSSEGRFRAPDGIALDGAGNVYVLDGGNNRVEVFDADGRFETEWGSRGAGLGQFSQPDGLAVGCEGSVYVADTNNNRIERFNLLAAAPSGCEGPGRWPPPLAVAPVLRVSLTHSSGVLARRGLALTVACRRACTISIRATLATTRGRRGRGRAPAPVLLVGVARGLSPGRAGVVWLRLGGRSLRVLRRRLAGRRGLLAHVTILATGQTGLRTVVLRSYLVTR